MNRPLLSVQNVSKVFPPAPSLRDLFWRRSRSSTLALEDISFSLEKGQTLCILGPNGAGKTTLLKIISTLLLPDQGEISLGSNKLSCDPFLFKSRVGLLIDEERSFYWRLTGRQNLLFFASLYGLSRRAADARIEELSAEFKVDYADRRFDNYSSGMKKRICLIRALLHDPELLLLDEPTKSLDVSAQERLEYFLKDILIEKYGKTIVLATHRIEEAAALATQYLILHKGRIRGFGDREELRTRLARPNAGLQELFLAAVEKEPSC